MHDITDEDVSLNICQVLNRESWRHALVSVISSFVAISRVLDILLILVYTYVQEGVGVI